MNTTINDEIKSPMLSCQSRKPSKKINQYLATTSGKKQIGELKNNIFVVSLGALCAGTTLAWSSPVLPQLSNKNGTEDFFLTNSEEAQIGSILTIGALISAMPAGYLADKFGRKKTILLISLTFTLSWILIMFAKNATSLIIGRLLAGLGLGAVCTVCPMYIGEIAELRNRGTLGSFVNMFLCVGIFLTCLLGSFTTWRTLSMLLLSIPILFGVSFCLMPETPTYLLKIKKSKSAEKSLLYFRGHQYDVSSELKEIDLELQCCHSTKSFGTILKSKANRKALFSVVAVLSFQQLTGVNAVVFYTVTIFQAAGNNVSGDLIGIIIALVQVIFAYVSLLVIEKANRKFYLMFSSIAMMLFLIILVFSTILFMIAFSIGYGPVPWLLMGELLSPEIKGIGNGFAMAVNWSCAFLVTYFFPVIKHYWGIHFSFYICAVLMGLATIFVGLVVPETRGKSLLEIQESLNK